MAEAVTRAAAGRSESERVAASAAPIAVAVARVIVGAAVVITLIVAYVQAGGGPAFDFFGYFTNFTSALSAALLIAAGCIGIRRSSAPGWLPLGRGTALACMLIVAVVYNAVVPGTGSAAPWISATLHAAFPALLLLDWVCVHDRPPLPWRRLWVVLPYPLVWLTVVLVRGATDGWVPYGFLLPERGAAALLATSGALLAALLASGALVWALSRVRARTAILRRAPSPAQ
ncbi:Pr6Pr family membrane protein [Leucobacter chromiiresistens]